MVILLVLSSKMINMINEETMKKTIMADVFIKMMIRVIEVLLRAVDFVKRDRSGFDDDSR